MLAIHIYSVSFPNQKCGKGARLAKECILGEEYHGILEDLGCLGLFKKRRLD